MNNKYSSDKINNNRSKIEDQLEFLREISSNDRDLAQQDSFLTSKIYQQISKDLDPSLMAVSLRLLGVHFFSSLLTLSICPQFGFRLIGDGHGLMALFMYFGLVGCYLLCGAFYLGVTVFLSKVILSKADWRVVDHHFSKFMLALSISSLAVFLLISGELFLVLSIAWLVGAVASAKLIQIPFKSHKKYS